MKKTFLLLLFALGISVWGWGQQVIGSFPSMDGGFENQAGGTLSLVSTINSLQSNWTVGTTNTGVVNSTGGRSGPQYVTFTMTGTSHRRLQSPTANVTAAQHVVQFYYQGDLDGGTYGDIRGAASAVGTSSPAYGSYVSGANTGAVWTKYTAVVTTTGTPANGIGIVSVNNTAQFKIDDFVVYLGSAVDETPPNQPGEVTIGNPTQTSLDVSWGAASGGVDGGGYLVVRFASDPGTGNDPNQNGIYAVGNTIPTGGTVRYIGTGLSFTDDVGLTAGTQYWYKVYTVDKAFNYSAESTGDGSTSSGSTPIISVTPSTLSDFTYVEGSGPSASKNFDISGENLTHNIYIAASTNYEISLDDSDFSESPIILTQSGGSVSSTTIYVRLKAGLSAGSYNSEVITASSTGADNKTVSCSGSVSPPPDPEPTNHATDFTATTNSHNQITLTWTDATGAQLPHAYLVKAAVAPATPTAPTDGVAEGDGTLVKNIDFGDEEAVFTGLEPGTTYNFAIWSYTNSGSSIDYKTSPTPPSTSATTDVALYNVGDFGFTATTGNWGTTNANWKQWDGSGWNTTPAGVPTSGDNVIILAGNTCIVEASGKNSKNLTVEAGAKLYTNNTTMGTPRYVNVSGNIVCNGTIGNGSGNDDVISFNILEGIFTISGNGSFTANRLRRNSGSGNLELTFAMDAELRYNGLALYNATSSPTESQKLIIKVNHGSHLNLTGNGATPTAGYELKSVDQGIISGSITITGALTNSGSLIIKSDASGTGSLIINGSISGSGTATVERYLTQYQAQGDNRYHFISSPVTAQNIQPEFVNDPPSPSVDFYKFSETDYEWVNSKLLSGDWNPAFESQFEVGRGYMVAYSVNLTKNFTGVLNNNASYMLTCTHTTDQGNGWNLLGNPYQAAIDWDAVTLGDGMDNALYYYDSQNEKYRYYISYPGINNENYLGSGSRYIPPMQGFMVHAQSTGTKTVTIEKADLAHQAQSTFYKSGYNLVPGSMALTLISGERRDEAFVHFTSGATEAFDGQYDAYKLLSGNAGIPEIYTTNSGNVKFAINGLPELSGQTEVPVSIKANQPGVYSISADLSNLPATAYLNDIKTGTVHNLSQNPVYTFTAAEGDAPNRFKLTFGSVGIDTPAGKPIAAYYAAGRLYFVNAQAEKTIEVFNLAGQRIIFAKTTADEYPVNLSAGMYVVKVSTAQQLVSAKFFVK